MCKTATLLPGLNSGLSWTRFTKKLGDICWNESSSIKVGWMASFLIRSGSPKSLPVINEADDHLDKHRQNDDMWYTCQNCKLKSLQSGVEISHLPARLFLKNKEQWTQKTGTINSKDSIINIYIQIVHFVLNTTVSISF